MLPSLLPPEPALGPLTWNDVPLAAELRPLGWNYGTRYQELLADVMGGRDAAATFGPVVAKADVYWRFELAAPGRMVLDEGDPADWRDAALAGSLVAVDRLLRDTTARAPRLEAARVTVATLLDPTLLVARDAEGVHVARAEGGPAGRRVDRAELVEGDTPARGADARRPPQGVSMGLDWSLRDEDDPPRSPLVHYAAWISTTNLGPSSLRAEYALASGDWELLVRQRLLPHTSAFARADGSLPSDPARGVEGGLQWNPRAFPNWNVRAQLGWDLGQQAWTARWLLRGELHTPIPAVPGQPLGERGLCFPALPENEPAPMVWLSRPSPGGQDPPPGCTPR